MQMHVARESPGTERGQPDDGRLIAESWRVPERFGVVFDRHAAAIHGYIARRLGRDAADDLVGETFLVAFGRRGGYDPEQPSARPWLYGIATRLVSRRRRDEVRFFRAIARTGIDPAADPVAEPVQMKLLEDFRAVVAPPDEELLARTRARVLGGGRGSRRAQGGACRSAVPGSP
jgi:DNA-directed RNA polymerase specialized sigma24 family protein